MPCVDCDGAMLMWIDLQIRIKNLLLQSAEESNACVDAMCRLLAEDCRRILTRLADCPFRHRGTAEVGVWVTPNECWKIKRPKFTSRYTYLQ
jgi:hypothetical protein